MKPSAAEAARSATSIPSRSDAVVNDQQWGLTDNGERHETISLPTADPSAAPPADSLEGAAELCASPIVSLTPPFPTIDYSDTSADTFGHADTTL